MVEKQLHVLLLMPGDVFRFDAGWNPWNLDTHDRYLFSHVSSNSPDERVLKIIFVPAGADEVSQLEHESRMLRARLSDSEQTQLVTSVGRMRAVWRV